MFNKKLKERIKELEEKVQTQEVELFRIKADGKEYLAEIKRDYDVFYGFNDILYISGIVDDKVVTVTTKLLTDYAQVKSICGNVLTITAGISEIDRLYLINSDLSVTALPNNLRIKPEIPTYNFISPRRKKAKLESVATPEPKKRGGRPSSTGQRFISKCKNGFKIQKDGKYLGFQKTLEDAIKLRDYLLQEHE